MLVFCCHCHEETNQVLVCVNSSRSTYDILLTTYRCHQCWKYTYGMCDRTKYDTKKYPYLSESEIRINTRFFDPTDLDDSIKDDSNDFIEDDVFLDE